MVRKSLLKSQGGILSFFLIVLVVLSTMIPKVKAWTEGNLKLKWKVDDEFNFSLI
jgi:hypothetical protein